MWNGSCSRFNVDSQSGLVAAGPMWNGSGSSSRAVDLRTGYRRREPSQRTVAGPSVYEPSSFTMSNSCSGERTVAEPSVFEPSSLTMLNSCSGERTVAGPSVFELSTFAMSTKYPYSALARNYIVQSALTRRPPRFAMMSASENSYWTVTTRLSTVAHAYRFPIGRPLQYAGLL